MGPLEPKEVQSDFQSFFQKRVVVDGSCFCGLDSAAAQKAAVEAITGFAEVEGRPWPEKLAKLTRKHFQDYMVFLPQRRGSISGTMCADLSQNPRVRDRATPWMPTLARTSKMVCMHAGGAKVFTPKELAFAEGWPSLDFAGNAWYRHLGQNTLYLHSASATQRIQGNAMHLHVITAWFAYIAAHCIQRDLLEAMAPIISWHPPPGSPGDDPEEASCH